MCQPLSSNIVPPSPNTPKPLPFAYLLYALHLNELPFLPSSMNSLLYTYISKNVDYTYTYMETHYRKPSLSSSPLLSLFSPYMFEPSPFFPFSECYNLTNARLCRDYEQTRIKGGDGGRKGVSLRYLVIG